MTTAAIDNAEVGRDPSAAGNAELDRLGELLVALLKRYGAVGRKNAVHQAIAADGLGISARRVQQVTLRLNELSIAVISSVTPPYGIYLAETVDELGDYEHQLRSRLIGNATRCKHVRRMRRAKLAECPVDPTTGQQRFNW